MYKEPTLIRIDQVSNNLKKGVEYQIYKRKTKDDCIEMMFGNNILTVNKKGVSFIIQDNEPFKYYRGVLGLEERTKLYIDFARKYFADKEGIEVESSCEDEGSYMIYSIELTSESKDVTTVVNAALDFETKFDEKMEQIEKEVEGVINKYC